MFSFVQVVAFAFAASFVWAADNITVADPTGIVQCVPYTFTWSGGTLPYTVIVDTVGFSLTSPAIKIFNNVNETSVEWAPDQGFPGDLQIFIVVMDSAGAQSNSSTLTLAVGDVTVDDAGRCLNNATLSAIDTLTTGTGFRTTTPGAQQYVVHLTS
ncbi:hypothetical protein C8R43DRAFT_1000048 [Mycena crocata]|nr:hypothetical protein C8R43DRAFT_1000048 [Mycena crocata]